MDFTLTDDDLALRDAVRRFCDGEYPAPERGNPETPAQADQRRLGLANLGLLGLQIPDESGDFGGSGLGPVAAMVVAEELGRALAGGNWLANAVLAAPLLVALARPAQAAGWLPALTDGSRRFALACHEPDARYDLADVRTRARPGADGGWVLSGRKALVLDGEGADILLVVARTAGERRDRDGLSLFAVPADTAGVSRQGFALLDGRRAAHLELQAVNLPAEALLGTAGQALPFVEAALDRAEAVLCAEAAGALDTLLAQTCEHMKTRRQFGAPLAKFQALQHQVADMALALEQLKSMACVAAMAVDAGADVDVAAPADVASRARLVSAAKALMAQLGRRCGLMAIQLHGAMGMTDECRIGHYAKRLMTNGQLFGDAAFHLARFQGLPASPTSVVPRTSSERVPA